MLTGTPENREDQDLPGRGLRHFSADPFAELFGAPDDPPSTLLWLANKVWDSAAAVIHSIRDCRRPRNLRP